MFGSLILPTTTGAVSTSRRRGGGGGGGGGGIQSSCPRDHLSSMGSIPSYHHPTMSFPSRKLPRTRIRASSSSSSFTTASPADTLPRVELISKPNTTTTLNLYQILRIKQNASSLDIKTAYRKLAKQFHPDALPPPPPPTTSSQSSSSDDDDDAGARDFMAIHNAYATLSDPMERARYDLSIQIQSNSSSHTIRYYSSSSSSAIDGNEEDRRTYGMQTRRWETDQCW